MPINDDVEPDKKTVILLSIPTMDDEAEEHLTRAIGLPRREGRSTALTVKGIGIPYIYIKYPCLNAIQLQFGSRKGRHGGKNHSGT
jgi:hypothetical protein